MTGPQLSDADMWDHLVGNQVNPDSATNLVKQRTTLPPDQMWDHLVQNGMSPDSATSIVSKATGTQPLGGGKSSALDAGLTHAGVAATYGFARDAVPAAMYAIEHIPNAYKLFTDPATGKPRTQAPSFGELRQGWTGELAKEQHDQPVASTVGSIAGTLASPLNTLLPGGPGVVGGLKGGAAGAALAAAGNAPSADRATSPSLMERLKSAAIAAPFGAAAGGLFSGVTGAVGNKLQSPLVNAEIAKQAASNPGQVQSAFQAAVDRGPAITDPAALGQIGQLTKIPEWQQAMQQGQSLARKSGEIVPDLPGMEGAAAPKSLAGGAAADPAVVRRIAADNPGWSVARVMQAAQDPDLARGYSSGTLGNTAAPPPPSVTPRQVETLRQGVSSIGDPGQIARMQQLLKGTIDPLVPGYDQARALAAKKYALQELQGNPNAISGNVMQPIVGAGQVAMGGPVSKAAGLLKILNASKGADDLSPRAKALLDQIRGTVSGTPLGVGADAIGHMGWLAPGALTTGAAPALAPALRRVTADDDSQ